MSGVLAVDSGLAAVVAGRAVASSGPAAIVFVCSDPDTVAEPPVVVACFALAVFAALAVVAARFGSAAVVDPDVCGLSPFLCPAVYDLVAVAPARWQACSFPPSTW